MQKSKASSAPVRISIAALGRLVHWSPWATAWTVYRRPHDMWRTQLALVVEQEASGAPVVVALTTNDAASSSGAQVTNAWLVVQVSEWLWICGAHGAENKHILLFSIFYSFMLFII